MSSQAQSQSQTGDADVLRIMVTTDNHLGVHEQDEWRGKDSFDSFREVFEMAKHDSADMVLLGGDLFHDNKPSRHTLVNCLQILNEHCLGSEPIRFQTLSSPSLIQSGVENTQDPNLNVGLPVYTIHGNHDDPAGPEDLSAVDVLSTVHYVNYFGKHTFGREGGDDIGRIRLSPILLKKGKTKVALYGLGFMREERLARAFQLPGQVVWARPAEETETWFNIFVLHQNRVQHYKQGPNNAARNVQEKFLPEWLDVVVWGHEHESIAVMDTGDHFSILQPGSTVATSLSEPESQPKHCFQLEINGEDFRTVCKPLSTARPFKFTSVSLAAMGAKPGDQKGIEQLLADTVDKLIEESNEEQRLAPTNEVTQPLGPDGERAFKLPLVRLRVDYTGYSTIHSQRFGSRFVNRVANPRDILLWSKAAAQRKPKEAKPDTKTTRTKMPADLDNTQIEDLIAEFAGDLSILPTSDLGEALNAFVEKDEKGALSSVFQRSIDATQAAAMVDLTDEMDAADAEHDAEAPNGDADAGAELMMRKVEDTVTKAGHRLQKEANIEHAKTRGAPSARIGTQNGSDLNATQQDAEAEAAADDNGTGPSTGRRGAAAAAKPARKAAVAKPRGKAAGAAPKGRARGGAAAAKKAATLDGFLSQVPTQNGKSQPKGQTAKQRRLSNAGLASDSDDDFGMDEDPPYDEDSPDEAAPQRSKRAKTAARAGEDTDGDEGEDASAPAADGKGAAARRAKPAGARRRA